jgi:hypothetical protein
VFRYGTTIPTDYLPASVRLRLFGCRPVSHHPPQCHPCGVAARIFVSKAHDFCWCVSAKGRNTGFSAFGQE